MNKSEVAKLLAVVSAVDHRKVGEADVEAWFQIVADTRFVDAQAAVIEYFKDSKEWLAPSDVLRIVRRLRSARVVLIELPQPPRELADTPIRESAWFRQFRHAVADGLGSVAAIGAANQALGIVSEVEPLAVDGGPEATKDRMREVAEEIARDRSLREAESVARAEARRKFKADRATTLTDGEATA